jgi:CDP-diacylglycerol--serine O-phosphatidyltransferase
MKIKQNLPNIITLGNLLCGCLGIIACQDAGHNSAVIFILIATVLDFLDGGLARLLKVSSPIGKDLDSLADTVTFGVLPGLMAMDMIMNADILSGINKHMIAYSALLIPLFSAFRLAKFNNDSRQTDSFIGLPTPANALFFCGLSYGLTDQTLSWINHPILISIISVFMSILLVTELPMFSLKIKSKKWRSYSVQIVFLFLSALVIIMLGKSGFSFIILIFIFLSIIHKFIKQ